MREKTTEQLAEEVKETRDALRDLLVAVRGGGDLGPAMAAAQEFLDEGEEEAEEEESDEADGDEADEEKAAA